MEDKTTVPGLETSRRSSSRGGAKEGGEDDLEKESNQEQGKGVIFLRGRLDGVSVSEPLVFKWGVES